eukprot:2971953-Pyramimonas_sp.AAC.1
MGQTVPQQGGNLARLARIAFQIARARGPLEIFHVKSHCLHHWNILADNVAKQAAQQQIAGLLFDQELLSMASDTPSREWEWAREPFQHDDLGMPSLEEGTL